MTEQCGFMAEYLLRCIGADRKDDDVVHTGLEAGRELAAWLTHLVRRPDTRLIIADVATRLRDLFKSSDTATRIRIETATLEHALEVPALRPTLESWGADPILRDAFEAARAWGEARDNGAGLLPGGADDGQRLWQNPGTSAPRLTLTPVADSKTRGHG